MPGQPDRFDLIVVGAGSGTTVSAAAAQAGWQVAIVEAGPFGGTCLNRGCIPSKMLVHVADVARTIRRAHLFGIDGRIERIDWPAIIARVSRTSTRRRRQSRKATKRPKASWSSRARPGSSGRGSSRSTGVGCPLTGS